MLEKYLPWPFTVCDESVVYVYTHMPISCTSSYTTSAFWISDDTVYLTSPVADLSTAIDLLQAHCLEPITPFGDIDDNVASFNDHIPPSFPCTTIWTVESIPVTITYPEGLSASSVTLVSHHTINEKYRPSRVVYRYVFTAHGCFARDFLSRINRLPFITVRRDVRHVRLCGIGPGGEYGGEPATSLLLRVDVNINNISLTCTSDHPLPVLCDTLARIVTFAVSTNAIPVSKIDFVLDVTSSHRQSAGFQVLSV